MKNLESQKSLMSAINNLKEFYTRYKNKIPDYRCDLLLSIK